jgi:tripeptide aminopeptidase
MNTDRLLQTLIELVSIPSTSGHEEQVRAYLEQKLALLGLSAQVDALGNLIGLLPGDDQREPLLLNAHMDRVPPGLGHTPVLREGILYSDGKTNLGADDAAGIAVILETLAHEVQQHLPHPPLVIVFTVQEEAGICGATKFDAQPFHVSQGIVFDNAFDAGVVVSKGAAYEAFDVRITGRTGHPGKDLTHTVNAIDIFRAAQYPHGSLDHNQTRILIGRIDGGHARNAIPATLTLEGELRSFAEPAIRQRHMEAIQQAFQQAARQFGGKVEITFQSHSKGYSIDESEPLLTAYRSILAERGAALQLQPTFIGSDTSGFRPTIKAFTISTGVVNEHSVDEYVPIEPLGLLVENTLRLLEKLARGIG